VTVDGAARSLRRKRGMRGRATGNALQVPLQRRRVLDGHDRPDVPVRPDQDAIAGCNAIRAAELLFLVGEVAASAHGVDVQAPASTNGGDDPVAQERPVSVSVQPQGTPSGLRFSA
jgi:hypothetical protein